MGDGEIAHLRLQFNLKVRLEFHGSTITSDAGLLAFREFDDALGLTEIAEDYLQESRTGRNILHHLVPLLRQSIYSRLAGYDDTNDAVRLSQDPAMRVIVGWQGSERKGASTSEMGRFETEFLTQEDNLKGLARINTQWVERAMAHTLHRRVILDMDSSESPVHGQQEGAAYNGHFECVCYHPLFLFNQFGDCEAAKLRSGCCFVLTPPSPSRRYTIIWTVWGFYAWQYSGCPMKAGTLSESGRIRPHLTLLECGIIFGGIPAGAISRKGGLIWGIPD